MPAIDAEFVRVKQVDTDWELTVLRSALIVTPGAYEVLDKPATDAGNNPLPPKPKTTVGAEVEKQKAGSGQKATHITKES
jgi:hypothetical protein